MRGISKGGPAFSMCRQRKIRVCRRLTIRVKPFVTLPVCPLSLRDPVRKVSYPMAHNNSESTLRLIAPLRIRTERRRAPRPHFDDYSLPLKRNYVKPSRCAFYLGILRKDPSSLAYGMEDKVCAACVDATETPQSRAGHFLIPG